MVSFGPDISSYQNGLDLAQLRDASFVIAKTTEGTYYTDGSYEAWRRQAADLRLPFVWYHFLSAEGSADQVAHTLAHVGDTSLPGMLDVEPNGSFRPTLQQVLDYADAARRAGLRLRLVYLPRWYWSEMGAPDLTVLAREGLYLVSSSYPGGTGSARALYPGDPAAGWNAYGGVVPFLYQFTNQATDGGRLLDYNALRGSVSDLLAVLYPTGESNMGSIPPSIAQRWPDIAADFPPDAPFTDETALIWADAGARAAALYARQARDAVDALAAHFAPPPVDVDALAQALAPHLSAGATPDQVAQAVVDHLAATLSKG